MDRNQVLRVSKWMKWVVSERRWGCRTVWSMQEITTLDLTQHTWTVQLSGPALWCHGLWLFYKHSFQLGQKDETDVLSSHIMSEYFVEFRFRKLETYKYKLYSYKMSIRLFLFAGLVCSCNYWMYIFNICAVCARLYSSKSLGLTRPPTLRSRSRWAFCCS